MTAPARKAVLLACGSFNPVTNMHLRIFERARDFLRSEGLYEVVGGLVSPVHDAYGKPGLEASHHRISMLQLALHTSDWITVDCWECEQQAWTPTRQVLDHAFKNINERNTGDEISLKLLCGADVLETFAVPGLWAVDDMETIAGKYGMVVATRSGSDAEKFIQRNDTLRKHVDMINLVPEWISNDISATKIRDALAKGDSVKYLLQDSVIEYIHQHKLYQN